jgi:hypothetical protein
VVFSAGINPRLYGYTAEFEDFFPDESGNLCKKIILKVSDFRSALIQGKFLAKRGLWVSEYRIESGLNCGGHAFATDGYLMGPILEEFRRRKAELIDSLHQQYNKTIVDLKRAPVPTPHSVRLTVQGGIGTAEEDRFLLEHYELDGTGWGTPFLLVPEATNVDDAHLMKLSLAGDEDVYLSDQSPLGIPFWSLRSSASEQMRDARIAAGRPGSPCRKGYLTFDTEFTRVPICRASRAYQKRKLAQLEKAELSPARQQFMRDSILAKTCLCHDLAGGAILKNDIEADANPSVCCGPNIVNFSATMSLETIVGHIYGRLSVLTNGDRPHMFIRELELYIEHLQSEVQKAVNGFVSRSVESFAEFKQRLAATVDYYEELAEKLIPEERENFLRGLRSLAEKLETILPEPMEILSPGHGVSTG